MAGGSKATPNSPAKKTDSPSVKNKAVHNGSEKGHKVVSNSEKKLKKKAAAAGATTKDKEEEQPLQGLAAKLKNLRKKLHKDADGGATTEECLTRTTSASVDTSRKGKDMNSKSSKKKVTISTKKAPKTPTEEKSADTDADTSTTKKAIRSVPTTSKQLENYVAFIKAACELGVAGIVKQFNDSLKCYVPPNMAANVCKSHTELNRYKDILCLDASRLVLKSTKGEHDYIHANTVDCEILCNKFICTQGPLATTAHDFWRMIVQEHCKFIFMLCQCVEMNKDKCFQYWPDAKGATVTFKDITVRNSDVDNKDSTNVISTLHVVIGGKDVLTVKHFHWQNWPDRSVPASTMAPFRMLKEARHCKYPTVVHCSAGVGRTGAVVGIEMGLQQILSEKPVNLVQMVQDLRGKRLNCVQTDLQMCYIYRCLFAYADSCGVIKTQPELEAKSKAFIKDYEALLEERQAPAATPAGGSPPPPPNTPSLKEKDASQPHAPAPGVPPASPCGVPAFATPGTPIAPGLVAGGPGATLPPQAPTPQVEEAPKSSYM